MEVIPFWRAKPPAITYFFSVKIACCAAIAGRLLPASIGIKRLRVCGGRDTSSNAEQETDGECVSGCRHVDSFMRVAARARPALRDSWVVTGSPCDQLFAAMQIQPMAEASVPDDEVILTAVALGMILYVLPVVLGPSEQEGAAE